MVRSSEPMDTALVFTTRRRASQYQAGVEEELWPIALSEGALKHVSCDVARSLVASVS